MKVCLAVLEVCVFKQKNGQVFKTALLFEKLTTRFLRNKIIRLFEHSVTSKNHRSPSTANNGTERFDPQKFYSNANGEAATRGNLAGILPEAQISSGVARGGAHSPAKEIPTTLRSVVSENKKYYPKCVTYANSFTALMRSDLAGVKMSHNIYRLTGTRAHSYNPSVGLQETSQYTYAVTGLCRSVSEEDDNCSILEDITELSSISNSRRGAAALATTRDSARLHRRSDRYVDSCQDCSRCHVCTEMYAYNGGTSPRLGGSFQETLSRASSLLYPTMELPASECCRKSGHRSGPVINCSRKTGATDARSGEGRAALAYVATPQLLPITSVTGIRPQLAPQTTAAPAPPANLLDDSHAHTSIEALEGRLAAIKATASKLRQLILDSCSLYRLPTNKRKTNSPTPYVRE
ncbi:hypothetical protein EVAR_93421_1 [Eumeta japonica]|uniref:Uncharacterized protein n=1 Tax=Eumeta variegata TaxID=151549 RepID=A0A4C1URL6_EUMVA|nr:hypothetical protein EVAR_93421_1 [Eumeta japonica]